MNAPQNWRDLMADIAAAVTIASPVPSPDPIFDAIAQHQTAVLDRSRFPDDLDAIDAEIEAAFTLATTEPATIHGLLAVLGYMSGEDERWKPDAFMQSPLLALLVDDQASEMQDLRDQLAVMAVVVAVLEGRHL